MAKQKRPEKKGDPGFYEHGDPESKDWETPCCVCGEVPTVEGMDLCGPCCFGEAETAGGNW